jgi:hypothetical protein
LAEAPQREERREQEEGTSVVQVRGVENVDAVESGEYRWKGGLELRAIRHPTGFYVSTRTKRTEGAEGCTYTGNAKVDSYCIFAIGIAVILVGEVGQQE